MSSIKFKSIPGAMFLTLVMLLQFSNAVSARDTTQDQPIADAMETATAKSFTGVTFYFGDQSYPGVKRTIGSYTAKRLTNAFGKSDYNSCQWAFLSGIKSLYERVLAEGGNAVVNIQSITTGKPSKSVSQFICRTGNVVTKVYLSGDVVEI